MNIRRATLSGTALRGTAKIVTPPWFSGLTLRQIGTPSAFVDTNASATPHADGAWTQLYSTISEDIGLLWIGVGQIAVGQSGVDSATAISIGVGAAGSETSVVTNIACGGMNDTFGIPIPIRIPSGSRISYRVRSAVASKFTRIYGPAVYAVPNVFQMPTSVDVLGVTGSTSKGTALSGASGTWTTVAASTSQDYQGFVLVPSINSNDILSIAPRFTLGVGAAGEEVEIGANEIGYANTEAVSTRPFAYNFPVFGNGRVAAGSRIAVKHTIAANPDRYAVCVIGIPYA
jgi:hypothetical protein